MCVCDTLCLKIREETEGPCDCDVAFAKILWDHDACAYVGTAACGSLSIDVRFDIKKCSDGTCRLCLTSTCLGLTGQCSTSSGCNEFAPGHNGDCGTYLKDCEQDGGWDETWLVDATGCLPPNTQISCPSISIRAYCYPRVNPAGSGLTRLCKDCDCVCECIEVGYEKENCISASCLPPAKLVCWENDKWFAAINLNELTYICDHAEQGVTVELFRNETTGCCEWKVTITHGVIAEGYPGAGGTIAYIKTDCPDFHIELGVVLPDESTAILTLTCATCGQDVDTCCACEWLYEYNLRHLCSLTAGRLKVTFEGPITGYAIICPNDNDVGVPNYCLQWLSVSCEGSFDNVVDGCSLIPQDLIFACIDKDQGGGFYMSITMGSADCSTTEFIQQSASCGPPLSVVFTATVTSIIPEEPCLCEGETITITVTPHDPV